MMWILFRPLFFLLDAERAHYLAMNALHLFLKIPAIGWFIRKSFEFESPALSSTCCGMTAKNPIGLAAGFDKNGKWLDLLATLGFGHIEVGTVTPVAQSGNPKPRLFRLKRDHSIINRMGFNNDGVQLLKKRLIAFHKPEGLIIGGNIGKNKLTSEEDTAADYLLCFHELFDVVDYFTINVSSPNTPGLRKLQDKEPLHALLSVLQSENQKKEHPKPLFLKIAPDLDPQGLDDILEVVLLNSFDGIIVSNTTISRPSELYEKEVAKETGGLSGEALRPKARECLQYLISKANNRLSFIGVGGIMHGKDAQDRIEDGADWIQIYSGMIYAGPWMIRNIKKYLAAAAVSKDH